MLKTVVGLAALTLAAWLVACGNDDPDTSPAVVETGEATREAESSQQATATAVATATAPAVEPTAQRAEATPTAPPPPTIAAALPTATTPPAALEQLVPDPLYDPTLMMYAKFPGLDRSFQLTAQSFESIRLHNDVSQVPVLVDLLMILPFETRLDVTMLLHDLTGQDIPGDDWGAWVEWLGKNREEYPPPEGYAAWKTSLFGVIDRRFPMLLRTAGETALIDLTELAWGGVPPDGIPDLQDPPVLSASEAAYLDFDERVFGLSINGEHRAYPLRIINPHEMVNDTLGGEPVALSW